jgi:hypothetical protein
MITPEVIAIVVAILGCALVAGGLLVITALVMRGGR